jgi:hypothetical protein
VRAAVLTTDASGRVTWTYSSAFASTPVIAATPVDTATGDATSLNVDIESVSTTQAVVRVWRTQTILGLGLFPTIPVGSGVPVHLMACLPN